MSNNEIDLKEEYLNLFFNQQRLNDAIFELQELNRTVKSKKLKELCSEFDIANDGIRSAYKL